MRVLYHHRTRGRHVEGVHIRGIVGALRSLGHEVSVLSFPGADPEREQPPSETNRGRSKLAALVTRAPGILFELLEIGYNLVTLFRVGRAMRNTGAELVYERYSLFLCATVWLARRRGIPVLLEINDSAVVDRLRPLHLKGLARRIEAWCWRNATGLVFISGRFRELATTNYGQIAPSVVSPNAADVERFNPARFDREKLRAQRGLEGRVVCGHIGVFARWHGLADFVARIVDRLGEAPKLCLLMVGDGEELPAVRELVAARGLADRILLPGRVAHEQVAEVVACMDYAVLPDSNEYGSPMKLFEFMAMGVGVVAADYEPVREVIADGESGWLFPHGDLDACVDRVLAVAAKPAEQRRVGDSARDYMVRERQWTDNARQLLSLLPEVRA